MVNAKSKPPRPQEARAGEEGAGGPNTNNAVSNTTAPAAAGSHSSTFSRMKVYCMDQHADGLL
jgi:hypothetical protein